MYDVRTWSFFQYRAAPTFHNRIHEGRSNLQNAFIIVSFHEVPSEAFTCLLGASANEAITPHPAD